MELLILLTAGLVTGILIGLFPVFPVYAGAFILYLTSGLWTPEQMLLFWIVASIGSQFFASVSAITLGIPGDASSLVYIKDVKKLSLLERNQLLWLTSRGSLISGIISLVLVWVLYYVYTATGQTFLFSIEAKLLLLYSVIFFFIVTSQQKILTLLLSIFGVLISPQNNYSLPSEWFHFSTLFQNTTFFMLILALMMIPDMLNYRTLQIDNKNQYSTIPSQMPWWLILKNSILGCLVGLIPGPAAEVAASAAYSSTRTKNTSLKIVAAETANNPGVVMMILPLLLLGLPFTSSSLIVSNIMDSKMVALPELARSASTIVTGFTVFDVMIIMAVMTTVIYYALSIQFINVYTRLVSSAYDKFKWAMIVLVLGMVGADIYIQEISWLAYATLLIFYIAVGQVLRHFRVSPVPMIFVYLLGDQLIWATGQFLAIHF
jgi:putative tricarboxylic transport membrane protein